MDKFVCPVCDAEFVNIDSFSKHVAEHAREEAKKTEMEKQEKLKAEKKALETKLVDAYSQLTISYNEYSNLMKEYRKKYGAEYSSFSSILNEILSLL